ncbi:MAG: hypothetical protein FK731_14810 [Asgard group archaeon]|nr:hypothetical protein [Asgard group archaeon]
MALDIIKEQRIIRTLFFSLIQSADLIIKNEDQKDQFCSKIAKFVQRTLIIEETRDIKETITELLNTLGWKSIQINFDSDKGFGKIILGKNRFFINEVADTDGTYLVLEAFFKGICYHIFDSEVDVSAVPSYSSGSYYEINFNKAAPKVVKKEIEIPTPVPKIQTERSIHETLTNELIFRPIFNRDIPDMILFETLWKVITESYIANYSTELDDSIKESLKISSLENVSLIIMKLTEKQSEKDLVNMAEIIGEFFVKLLSTKVTDPLIEKLQSTLQDRHATNYLIYYDCRQFCAEKKFVNRCLFFRSMWLGILNEIYGFPLIVKELFHAGKRDRYCMLEIVPDKQS